MITTNDINVIDRETISYIDVYGNTYQFETWDPMTLSELEDAKSQFALILNLLIVSPSRSIEILIDSPSRSIERHMLLNGFYGIADVYKSK